MEWLQQSSHSLFRLERDELIRMNQLARQTPGLDGYLEWAGGYSQRDRIALTCALLRYGSEYNDGSRWKESLKAAGVAEDSIVAAYLWDFRRDDFWEFAHREEELFQWLESLNSDDQLAAYKLAACFFAIHEQSRLEACKAAGGCDHWWHAI